MQTPYYNFMVTTNQKSTIDTQIRKSNPNTTLKIVIKPEEERTRGGKKKRAINTKPKQLIKWH